MALKLITKPPNTRARVAGKSLSGKTIFLPVKKTKTRRQKPGSMYSSRQYGRH